MTSPVQLTQEPRGKANTGISPVPFPVVSLRGMPIHGVTRAETVEYVMSCATKGEGGWVVTPNLDILRRHKRSASFRNLVATSTLNVADGMPLIWASRVKGQPLPGRVNGTDLMVDICEAVAESRHSVFFLGGISGSAEKTAANMREAFPGLKIAGCFCPEFGFESDLSQIHQIIDHLTITNPAIVFVGLGSPKQDVLINMLRLQFPHIWWLGVGVSFSFIADELIRAPQWAQKSGLEWLYRLFAEPKRLMKRYLVEGIPFFTTTLVVSAFERVFGKPDTQK